MSTFFKGIGLLLLAAIPFFVISCKHRPQNGHSDKLDTIHNFVNWVAVFKTGIDSSQRSAVIAKFVRDLEEVQSDRPINEKDSQNFLKRYLFTYVRRNYKSDYFSLENVKTHFCNCNDSLLWNVTGDIRLDSSGGPSLPKPTPPPPKTTVQGDPLAALARNDGMHDPKTITNVLDPASKVKFAKGFSMEPNAVIAVIDTGIDTTLFDPSVRGQFLWGGANGPKNLLQGSVLNAYSDDHVVRHGTAVAAIAMNAFYRESNNRFLPRIMALKALDSTGSGTLFDFCCAMSYAIQNHATVINASLGYYGEANDVLEHYLLMSTHDSIPVVVAAGNNAGSRDSSYCFNKINNVNHLINPSYLFYPACTAGQPSKFDVISVTGFSSPGVPCYYQNYSGDYVTLGVMNQTADTNCCSYSIPFIDKQIPVEGTSFATPVVSGRLSYKVARNGRRATAPDYLTMFTDLQHATPVDSTYVTQANNYFNY